MRPEDHAYGRLEGIDELREAVASHYNRLYRRGMPSQYSAQNVAVASGGRLALTRAMAALDAIKIGYQLPDYTAYEDMFNLHLDRISPTAVLTHEADGFQLTPEAYESAVSDLGLSAFILSNPCNPTGNVVQGDDLRRLVEISRDHDVTLLLDEFYSHFIYKEDGQPGEGPVSAAAFIEDVETDPIVMFDGLTKSFRYPGWRVGWVIGPEAMVESMARTASSIDGGPSRLAQLAALDALEPDQADQETRALRDNFVLKRNLMVQRLEDMGIVFAKQPLSTFYCWATLRDLPEPFNDAMEFFWRALDHKVMTVPGKFFDVNPGKQRTGPSPYDQWMRFSFGPPMDNMVMGLDRLAEMLGETPRMPPLPSGSKIS